ncbi:LysR family transcriptional regulator [Lentzea sp. JNUCC 0626]|uniref:LysR family transcriptional regulator n=1 Tax=Lentzea sp. JNUCC 0626 TaxID=3367513 RepID=UPI003748192C
MKLDRRHLELVVAAAEEGSLRRAAARLKLTQPAVTTQLRRIEGAVGEPLFVRHAGGMLLTQAGETFVRSARLVLRELAEMPVTIRSTEASRPSAPVRIGSVPCGQMSELIDVLVTLMPTRELTSRTIRGNAELLALLAAGNLDVALLWMFAEDTHDPPEGVVTRSLVAEPFYLGVGASHRLAHVPEVDLAELAEERWVLPVHEVAGFGEFLARACARAGFRPRIAHQVADSHNAQVIVARDHGITLVLPGREDVLDRGLRLVALAGEPLSRRLVLAWRGQSDVAGVALALHSELVSRAVTSSAA